MRQHTHNSIEKHFVQICETALADILRGCERVVIQDWLGDVYISFTQLGLRGGGVWMIGIPATGAYFFTTDDVYAAIAEARRLLVSESEVAA